MACCTLNFTSMNNYSSCATTFSSLLSFYTIYASTKWCSSTLSSFDSLMHTKFINVTPGHVCSRAYQCCLLLCKNSIANVVVISMSWIIVYANYIFSLYAFPSTHSKNDDECNGDLTTNNWIFNNPLFILFNSFSTFVLFNNFVYSSCLCLCSLLWASFSLAIRYSFPIALSTFILLWTPKFQKCAQLPQQM
jgi:hypothetical protein